MNDSEALSDHTRGGSVNDPFRDPARGGSRLGAEHPPASPRDESERAAEEPQDAEPRAGAPPAVGVGHAEREELGEVRLHHERDCSDASVM